MRYARQLTGTDVLINAACPDVLPLVGLAVRPGFRLVFGYFPFRRDSASFLPFDADTFAQLPLEGSGGIWQPHEAAMFTVSLEVLWRARVLWFKC